MGVPDPRSQLSLPPGFRFYPTDEELLVQYLCRKVAGHHFSLPIIGDVDLYKFDAWDLPSKALFGEKEWYFFSPRDRKYPNGSRPNRVAGSGYWKATGTDKIITEKGRKVGIKKALVFYVGKAPKGTKTNWIMHEYRLSEPQRKNGSTKLDEWVLCRIYKKNSGGDKTAGSEYSQGTSSSCSSQYDDVMESLPEIDQGFFSSPKLNCSKNFDDDQKLDLVGPGSFDWAMLAGLNPVCPELVQAQHGANVGLQNDIYALAPVGEEEVLSGLVDQRVSNSGFFIQNMNGLAQGFSGSVDPFGVGYPAQPGGWGFRQ